MIVYGVAYVGSFSHRIIGVHLRTGRTVLTFPHGQYVPGLGQRDALLLQRLLAHLRRRAAPSAPSPARPLSAAFPKSALMLVGYRRPS